MKNLTVLCTFILLISGNLLGAQETEPYGDVARGRAEKIVAELSIQDESKNNKVKQLIAQQYIDLNRIHLRRDEKLKTNKHQAAKIKQSAEKEITRLHAAYLKKLAKELDEAQIAEIKNGMTYHTVPLTYANYLLMLPYLSKEDKDKIWMFLIQGRERAMDGGTSKEKHTWFNNYKGKIANYLSEKGYQLKYEGEEWAKRRNIKSSALEITESNKVMVVLNLEDKNKKESVRNLIAYQYQQIAKIQAIRKAREEKAKNSQKTKEEIEKERESAWQESKTRLEKQRDLFVAELSKFLDKNQVEIVKNEITGQGLRKEYEKFQALLPNLTNEQKTKVLNFLLEARENAMNVLTSRERNQWFAKYRGRANNYLSAQGYDLRKATEELEKRSKTN